MSLGKVGRRRLSRVIRVGVVIANNVLSALAAFALNPNLVARVNIVTIVRRVDPGVASTGRRHHDTRSVIFHAAEEDSAAFMRVGFFSVLTDCVVVFAGEFQHRS